MCQEAMRCWQNDRMGGKVFGVEKNERSTWHGLTALHFTSTNRALKFNFSAGVPVRQEVWTRNGRLNGARYTANWWTQ